MLPTFYQQMTEKQSRYLCLLLFLFFCSPILQAQSASNTTIPSGEIKGPFLWKSQIYPGTERNYWIYVPQQYDADKPSCSMIVQDGLGRAKGWRLPQVLDSLIHLKKIPVVIGIFVDHGKVPASDPEAYPRFNRSFEYDALGDRYARFLIEELLPAVGKTYNLSTDPNDRSIAGASSGAICAFNAAWERPDAFSRVLSTIGTYVGMRGGDEFHTLVRKTEAKPLRIFLEDGNTDLNIYAGDWWMANQTMLSALTWAGYEVKHTWGTEGHNSKGGRKVLPEALQWLWQGYPKRVGNHPTDYKRLQLTTAGETWEKMDMNGLNASAMAVNEQGTIFFADNRSKGLYQLDKQGQPQLFKALSFEVGALAFGQNNELYLSNLDRKQIVKLDKAGKMRKLVRGLKATDMAVSSQGLYFTDPAGQRIGLYSFADQKTTYTPTPGVPGAICLSADQTFLNVSWVDKVLGHSYKIAEGGKLSFGQAYIHYHIPYGEALPAAQAITVDASNRTYTATSMGVQVADQLGRINFILSKTGKNTTAIQFGGEALAQLYLISDGQLYVRQLKTKGVLPWLPAIQPPKPKM